MQFSNKGWELNITARACFHVYDCRVAILFEIAMFSSFHRNQMQQQRPVASGISRVPRSARGSSDTGLLHRQYVNTSMRKHSRKRKMSTRIDTHTRANISTNTPPTTTCHIWGFHVLCPNFWLVPTSKQGVLVYFLAASKYFTWSAFMSEIWAVHGRYVVSQDSWQPANLQQGETLTGQT